MMNMMLSENYLTDNTKPCPRCQAPIQKSEGCNKMTCNKYGVIMYYCFKTADLFQLLAFFIRILPNSLTYFQMWHSLLLSLWVKITPGESVQPFQFDGIGMLQSGKIVRKFGTFHISIIFIIRILCRTCPRRIVKYVKRRFCSFNSVSNVPLSNIVMFLLNVRLRHWVRHIISLRHILY